MQSDANTRRFQWKVGELGADPDQLTDGFEALSARVLQLCSTYFPGEKGYGVRVGRVAGALDGTIVEVERGDFRAWVRTTCVWDQRLEDRRWARYLTVSLDGAASSRRLQSTEGHETDAVALGRFAGAAIGLLVFLGLGLAFIDFGSGVGVALALSLVLGLGSAYAGAITGERFASGLTRRHLERLEAVADVDQALQADLVWWEQVVTRLQSCVADSPLGGPPYQVTPPGMARAVGSHPVGRADAHPPDDLFEGMLTHHPAFR